MRATLLAILVLPISCIAQPSMTGPEIGSFNRPPTVSSGGPINPNTLGAIVLYDPSQQNPTIGAANLTDFSGNNRTCVKNGSPYLTNNAAELRGTNWWGVAAPGGGSHYWSAAFASQSQPITVYVAGRPRSPTGSVQYLFDAQASNHFLFTLNNPTPTFSAGSNITGGNQLATRWYWFEFQGNGASSFGKTNNVTLISTANAGSGGLSGVTLGVNQATSILGQWDIAYFQAVPSSVSSTTSGQVYQWATNRFGSQLQ